MQHVINFKFGAVQKGVDLLDLVKSFQTSISVLFHCKNRRGYSRERALQSFCSSFVPTQAVHFHIGIPPRSPVTRSKETRLVFWEQT